MNAQTSNLTHTGDENIDKIVDHLEEYRFQKMEEFFQKELGEEVQEQIQKNCYDKDFCEKIGVRYHLVGRDSVDYLILRVKTIRMFETGQYKFANK